MRAGKLREPITVQYKSEETVSAYGEAQDTWTALYTDIWAGIKPVNASEGVTADQSVARRTHEITVRSKSAPAVDENMRVVYGSRKFYITGVRNWEERDIHTILDCREEV